MEDQTLSKNWAVRFFTIFTRSSVFVIRLITGTVRVDLVPDAKDRFGNRIGYSLTICDAATSFIGTNRRDNCGSRESPPDHDPVGCDHCGFYASSRVSILVWQSGNLAYLFNFGGPLSEALSITQQWRHPLR